MWDAPSSSFLNIYFKNSVLDICLTLITGILLHLSPNWGRNSSVLCYIFCLSFQIYEDFDGSVLFHWPLYIITDIHILTSVCQEPCVGGNKDTNVIKIGPLSHCYIS